VAPRCLGEAVVAPDLHTVLDQHEPVTDIDYLAGLISFEMPTAVE
jgi:hypothetical protein